MEITDGEEITTISVLVPETQERARLSLFSQINRFRGFHLHKYSINQFPRWLSALDRFHYSLSLSIHLHDTEILHQTDPQIFDEFPRDGNFVISRTQHAFSLIRINQHHEQLNKDIKDDGGIIGLTENKDQFNRWLVCTPKVARAITEFYPQTVLRNNEYHQDVHHHQDSKTFQARFQSDVCNRKAWKSIPFY